VNEALISALGVALSPLPIAWTLRGLAIGAKLTSDGFSAHWEPNHPDRMMNARTHRARLEAPTTRRTT
jgi:hypothetical protein